MRRHLWMHVGLIAVMAGVFGLRALGVTIPTAVIYLVVLACPLMMVSMMLGMDHDHDHDSADSADGGSSVGHDHEAHPPASSPR
jgi:uncharacterized membrane protein